MRERIRNATLVGRSAKICEAYDIPPDMAAIMARRVGANIGENGIAYEKLEQLIIDNLSSNGQPNWDNIVAILTQQSKRLYEGKQLEI